MRRLCLLPVDLVAVAASHVLAYLVRFDGRIPTREEDVFWTGIAIAVVVMPVFFVAAGFYRRLWRYASIEDLVHIVKTVSLASVTTTCLTLILLRASGYPRSIPILSWFFLTALILARSLAWRVLQEHHFASRSGRGAPTLIVGAGMGGKRLLQEIKQNRDLNYRIVGFLDDDRAKIGAQISGLTVLGPIGDLGRIAGRHEVEKVIIAIPSAPSKLIRDVVHLSRIANLEVQTLPTMADMLDRSALASQVRKVNLHDLLGRDPVRLDAARIRGYLSGKRILVTGAGGSIGSEICRQVARFRPSALILFEVAETPLHDISLELQREHPNVATFPVLADIRDREQVFRIFHEAQPDVVFHAAAYKHVPMVEQHPFEGIKTNVFGTQNVAEAADDAGAETFVMISTDKAVNPTNVMGATKRVAEMFIQALDGPSATAFITVRFGNVLGSNGSVVPLFQDQIRKGGPVTVTHPDVIRYFMTISEASQLVLQAGSMGQGGEILLLDMGEPVKIADLAEELIRLSGFQPHEDIEIVFTGLRPGEKLFEELLIAGEGVRPTEHKKILVAGARAQELSEVRKCLRSLLLCVRQGDVDHLLRVLREVVPEFRSTRRPAPAKLAVQPLPLPAAH